MITKLELLKKQKELGLPLSTIEKDYILGLILSSLYRHPIIKNDWVFKGGTCLRKIYFKNYRMSEDLDFTLKESSTVEPKLIQSLLVEAFEIGETLFGLSVKSDDVNIQPFPDKLGLFIQIKIPFQSPLMSSGSLPKIKLDLAKNELLVEDTVSSPLRHDYSDEKDVIVPVTTYSIDELFAEKIRALVERTRPRDLYDVVQIYERVYEVAGVSKSFHALISKKFNFKSIEFCKNNFLTIYKKEKELSESWKHMLAHQIKPLSPFKEYIEKLKKVEKIFF